MPLLDELRIPYLNLLPELRKAGSLSGLARDRYHPSPKGHEVAAEAICHYLQARALLP
jgi:lysophospholipase L1-like esterase